MRRLRSPGFEWLRRWIRTPSPHKAWLGSRSRRERSDSGWDTCFPLFIISWTGGTGLSSASAGHDYLKREPPECVGRVIMMQYATHAPSRADTFPRERRLHRNYFSSCCGAYESSDQAYSTLDTNILFIPRHISFAVGELILKRYPQMKNRLVRQIIS